MGKIGVLWKVNVALLLFLVMVLWFPGAMGGRRSTPIRPKSRLTTQPEWTEKRSKSSECRLGKMRYPLNATWSPDLGPPFGVWTCVKCTCSPVQKKRRVVAKVTCKNIKQECPETKCEKPVLAPGTCCKRCPSDSDEFLGDSPVEESEIESLSGKEFAVLLNGRTSETPVTSLKLATGRIFMRRGALHFSFVLGPTTPSPTTIQFMDSEGNILEELEAHPTPYEVNNGRVCGTWTRVPKQYRSLLMNEKLWVGLLFPGEEDVISGQIARYKGVDTEIFSALLSPSRNQNETFQGGGTAIISVSAPSDSLHISLLFNGIFKSGHDQNATIAVELIPSRNLQPVKDIITLSKVNSDINKAELMTTLGETSLRLLTRGKVAISIWNVDFPDLRLEGDITSRAMCNVFHSVMTSKPNPVASEPSLSYGAGWGIVFVHNDGDFEYQMKLKDLPRPVEKVLLQMTNKKTVRSVEDITDSYKDGWVNGTYSKPTFRDLDSLFRGRLEVVVRMAEGRSIEGLFESVSVTEALRTFHPSLLTSPSSWMAATAWLAVDHDCIMHYDVHLGGDEPFGAHDPTWSLQLRENDTLWDPRLDFVNVTLEHTVTGREVSAHTTMLTKVTLSRLHAGATYLDLTVSEPSNDHGVSVVLTGALNQILVPSLCLLFPDGKGGIEEAKHPDSEVQVDEPCRGFVCLDEEEKPVISKKCIDNAKKVFEDGTTWKSPVNSCARCMCTLGRIKCQDKPCPKTSCPDAVHLPGQCCPSCPALNGGLSDRMCEMDADQHAVGSFWHPFLAPNGFDLCVTCYCNVSAKGVPVVECSRATCPPLQCLDSEANFQSDSCCPKCPPTTLSPRSVFYKTPSVVKGMVSEGHLQLSEKQKIEIVLANGGCLERKNIPRSNGDVWYPRLSPNGVPRCVACSCKDGRIACVREACTDPKCKRGRKCGPKKEEVANLKRGGGVDSKKGGPFQGAHWKKNAEKYHFHHKRKSRRKEEEKKKRL